MNLSVNIAPGGESPQPAPQPPSFGQRLLEAGLTLGKGLLWLLVRLWKAWAYWKEATTFLPIVVGAFFVILVLIVLVTGRQIVGSVSQLFDMGMNAIGIMIAAVLTSMIQKALIGYRSEFNEKQGLPVSLSDDVHDTSATIAVFIACLWALGLFS